MGKPGPAPGVQPWRGTGAFGHPRQDLVLDRRPALVSQQVPVKNLDGELARQARVRCDVDLSAVAADKPPLCPAAVKGQPCVHKLQDLEAWYTSDPARYQQGVREAACGYAYTLGYRPEGGTLLGMRRDLGDSLPILADQRLVRTGRGGLGIQSLQG